MRKRLLSTLLALCMVLALLPGTAWAAEAPTSGSCGDDVTWSYSNGTLTIRGTGDMYNYNSTTFLPPWYSYCEQIKTVTIGAGVTSIAGGIFRGCSGLTSVTIPDSVTYIGNNAFDGCTGLTSVTIPKGVTSIERYAFRGCSGLISVTIPNRVTSIEDDVFRDCSGLTSVTIPSSVTSIGQAFFGCQELSNINVDSGNQSYTSLDGVLFSRDLTLLHTYPAGKSGSYGIPSSVTSIGVYAFHGCRQLTSVTIPSGVTSIGDHAFYDCSGLTSVTIPKGVTSIGDCAFSWCSGLKSVTIPEGVTSIGHSAFSGCSGLTSVTIPESVTSIEGETFRGCSGLTSVTIPESVTSIAYGAFSWCSGLTSVTIPESVTYIGIRAFDGCRGLTDVYYSGSETDWKAIRISTTNNGNSNLSKATIHYNSTGPEVLGLLDASFAGDRRIHYTATTMSAETKEAYIVAALYDGSGKLLETQMSQPLTLEKDKHCEGDLNFTNELANPKVVKVFLLDKNNYAPLCNAVSPSLSAN